MNKQTAIPSRERVAKRRAALRAQGLKPKQFWVPDVHSEEFKAQARRDALAIAEVMKHSDDLAFAEAAQYWPPDDQD